MDLSIIVRVNRISRLMALVFRGGAWLGALGVFLLLAASVIDPDHIAGWIKSDYPQVMHIMELQVFLLSAVAGGQLLLTVAAMASLANMFDSVSGAEPLNLAAARHMRQAGRWLLAATIYAMLAQIPASLIVSMYQPEGARFISIGLESSHASGVLAALVLYALASIQELAALVRDDHRQII